MGKNIFKKLSILLALMNGVEAVYDYTDLVPMSKYTKDYRTLSCWECMDAEGKMCHDKDHKSMIRTTGSSNFGHGVCCKPGSTNEHCVGGSGSDHVCSQPVLAKDTSDKYKSILSAGKNYQMFAFCPKTNPKMCGISNSILEDNESAFEILAGEKAKTITSNMRMREGAPTYRRYDSCYYEIKAVSQSELDKITDKGKNGLRIYVEITKMKQMNAYLYGGGKKSDSIHSIVPGNAMMKYGQRYMVDVSKGMLMVAFPNKDQETEFEFKYWVQGNSDNFLDTTLNWVNQVPDSQRNMALIIGGPVILIILLCMCICCCKCCRNKSSSVEIVDDSVPMDTSPRDRSSKGVNAGQDTSIQLEDMEDENIAIGHQNSKNKGDVQTDDQAGDESKKRYSRVKGEEYSTASGQQQKYPKGYENPFNGKNKSNKK